MADYIASADAGNGGTNVVLGKGDGKYKSHYEPSVRAMATGASLGLGEQFEMQYNYVDWYGSRYVTGDDVIRVTKRALERHMGAGRYGEEFTRFFTAVSLAKLGVKSGSIDLTMFAPPGIYGEAKERIIEGFSGEYATAKIKLKGDNMPREWEYSSINVIPEGIGAAAVFMLDEKGKPLDTDLFDGQVAILDIGAFTLDALLMTDGNFNPESLETATWANQGVNTHVREPILRKIHNSGEDFSVVTIDEVDLVLRKGLNGGSYQLTVAGKALNLQTLSANYFERYADWISNNICDGPFNSFRGIKSVILVGGGAVMVGEKLRQLYPDKIIDANKISQAKKIHPSDMNAVGGMRLAMMRTKQKV